jgi:translation initiation factor 3 subunit B
LEWEPNGGKRFLVGARATDSGGVAVIAAQSMFSLYEYDATATPGSQVKLIKTLTRSKSVDRIYWSPKGRFAVLAASNGEGQIEFWNIPRDVSTGNSNIELMSSQEHYLMGSAAWDPSGRYVVSIASSRGGNQRGSSETGYAVYDFRGTLLERFSVPHMKQCLWRPRPPTLLTGSHLKRIRKDLARYSTTFTEQDRKRRQKASLATSMHLLKLREEWQAWANTWAKTLAEEKSERAVLSSTVVKAKAGEDEYEEIQEIVEQVLEETIEEAPLQEGEEE